MGGGATPLYGLYGNVVVNFLSQVIFFVFLLFLGIVMYANEVESKKLPEIKN